MRAGCMRPSWSSFSSVIRASSADAVEAGQDDRVGRVVDDEVDAGEVLERADVAPLAADDASLHVVGRQLHDRDRRLGGVAGGEALHDHGEDVAHAAVGIALGLLLDLADEPRRVVANLVLQLLEQQVLGLRRRQSRRPLKRPHVALVRFAGLFQPRVERVLAQVEGGARRQRLLAPEQPLLEAAHLRAPGQRRVLVTARRGRLRPARRAARAGRLGAEGGGAAENENEAAHQPQGQHGCRDHEFHCPFPLPDRGARTGVAAML